MRFLLLAILVIGIVLTVFGCQGSSITNLDTAGNIEQPAKRLLVFVGSASKPAVEEVEEAFEAANPNIKLDITFGGSGTLLNQMTLEETGDVYMPGSDDYMDRAEQREAIKPETRQIISWLVPAIIVPKGNPKNIRTLKDLARPGMRIGLAKPDAVCLGNISEEILADVGLLEEVKKNVCAYGLSCSKTAHLAELGEVDAIIGWEVFAKWSPDKVETIPLRAKTARVRNIPAAQSAFTKQPELAQEFIDFLTSPVAQQIFQRHGYALQKPGAE